MEKERRKEIVSEINRQIMWSIDRPTYWSWGCDLKLIHEYQGMATLVLRVSGCLFKGYVYISLNEASDTYEIRTTSATKGRRPNEEQLQLVKEDVYGEDLGRILDGIIERNPEWSMEKYREIAQADSMAKGVAFC